LLFVILTPYTNRYQTIFLGHCFLNKNFGHQEKYYKAFRVNQHPPKNKIVDIKSRDKIRTLDYFSPHSMFILECYKCNNIGHEAQNFSLNSNEGVWKRKTEELTSEKCGLVMYA